MKKIWLFGFSFLLALGVASHLGMLNKSNKEKNQNSWTTYSKSKNDIITNYPSTDEELSTAKAVVSNGRIPQSISEENSSASSVRKRIIIGDFDVIKDIKLDKLKMSNQISDTWKDNLSNELLRFHAEETKILIKEEDSILKVQNGRGRLLEQVVVSYLQDDKMLSSFRALVDSQTGQVLETWDRTIHEKIGHHDKEEALTLPLYQDSSIKASIK